MQVRVADAVAASMAAPVMFRPVLAESHPDACEGPPEWTTRILADRTRAENVRQTAAAFLNYRGDTPAEQRYLHLSDGGVIDNFGLLSLQVARAAEDPPAPLTAREAIQARRILFIVVNAERVRPRSFQQNGTDAIGAYEMLYAPLDASTDVAKRAALDVWRAQLPALEADLRAWRCGLP
jgi:NTE family protein